MSIPRPPSPHDTTSSTRSFRRAAAVGAAAVLSISVLTACSDSDGGGDGAGGTTATDDVSTAATHNGSTDGTTDGPSTDGSADSSGSASADSRCSTPDLDITLGQSQGAAGSLLVDLDFTNTSAGDCTLDGYPGVALVDDAGEPVGAPATRDEEPVAATVDLASGDTATAALKIGRAEMYGDDSCGPTPATGLQVIVPDETETTVLDLADEANDLGDITACNDDSVELLTVQPLTPGA